ncbi:MAG: cysteine desulfurase NifS [Oscillospiraceae bacterium]
MKKYIYADNAATTKISDKIFDAMLPYLKEGYGNPSSIYKLGRDSAQAILDARKKVAKAINADPSEIFFTSGGSESDNWAIKSAARLGVKKGKKHIITSQIEHHAVLHTAKALEKDGFEVTYLPVDEKGFVSPVDVENAIKPDTCLVTIMFANNEIGTIEPIKEIGEICKSKGIYFHTDAVQAIGNVFVDVKEQNIDMLSLSGHKIHAQKGIGVLYCNKKIRLDNLIEGGGQEFGKRAGTENVAAIVGLGVAIEDAVGNLENHANHLIEIRDYVIKELLTIPYTRLNGDEVKRLPNNVNISIVGIEGEALLLSLDILGIAASSGSACTSGSLDPSHVLLAIGLKHEVAHGSLRLSFGDDITKENADYIIKSVKDVAHRLRAMSPLWEHIEKNEIEF